MAEGNASVAAWRVGRTMRRDLWWLQPLLTAAGLGAFVVYATWAAFQGGDYHFGTYLSPFYSPELFGESPHAWFGPQPALVAGVAAVLAGAPHPLGARRLPLHLLLLPRRLLQGVLGRSARRARSASRARATAASAAFPLILQNVHRYFLYLALLVPGRPRARRLEGALVRRPPTGGATFGIGVGTLVLAVNVVLLGGYTLRLPLAAAPGRRRAATSSRRRPRCTTAYDCVSCLNRAPHALGVDEPLLGRLRRRLRAPLLDGRLAPTGGSSRWPSYQTHRARRPGDRRRRRRPARRDRGLGRRASRSASSASRCSARRTRSWPRAASPRRWPTSTTATAGRSTSPTPCAAASTSTTGGWPSCTPRRRRTACASSRPGARSSTARRTAASCSATSAATATRASRTSATAPASR